uniref:MRG domain-containing protein n=1 Tax=Oryza glumipatula TaxID=40148 RepID=A0A0E0BK19_9ORYZ
MSQAGSESAAAKEPSFKEGERVLAYHGPLLYEAKVQKSENKEDEWRYHVHYLMQKLIKKTPRLLSRGRNAKVSLEKERKSSESLFMSHFPSTLKKQLVDDWEFVTQLGKLVKLPRSPTVDDILKKYLEHRTKKDNKINDSYAEILKGLRCYFDKALPAMLLYKKERQQYSEEVKGDVSPSTIYGAEHLLRLFVKLPELLASVNMEEDALNKLQQKLLDILKFLQKNQSSFFLSAYDGGSKAEGFLKYGTRCIRGCVRPCGHPTFGTVVITNHVNFISKKLNSKFSNLKGKVVVTVQLRTFKPWSLA